ncbi:MAG: hypothetical protein SchgKO_07450 [Schleiferiaceae bacterium]
MSYRGRSTTRRSFGSYLFEFIVVAGAILLAFSINDWRKDKAQEKATTETWQRIQMVLSQDQQKLVDKAQALDESINHIQVYLNVDKRKTPIDSLQSLVYPCLQYSVWSPPTSMGKFTSAKSMEMADSPLFGDIMALYGEEFEQLSQLSSMDQEVSTQRIIPFAESRFNFLQNPNGKKKARRADFAYGEFDAVLTTSLSIKSSTAESLREAARKMEHIRNQINDMISVQSQKN